MQQRLTLTAAAVATLFASIPTTHAESGDAVILVTATRQPTRHNELLSDSTVIDRKALEAAAPQQTLGDLLLRESGVEGLTTGNPGANQSIFIRGANASHTLLLIDGQRVGSATLGEPSLSRLPLAQIERVEILRGPASALYGSDAIGGVIQVFTRPTVEGTQFAISAAAGSHNTREINESIATRQGPISANLRFGILKSDGFNATRRPGHPAFPFGDQFNPDADGYENRHLTAGAAYAFNKDNEIGVSLFHSDGENQYDSGSDSTFAPNPGLDYKNRNKVTSGTVFSTNRLLPRWTSTVRLGQSVDDSISLEGSLETSRFKTMQRQLTWQNDLRLPVGTALVAIERLKQEIDTTTPFSVTERTIDSVLAGWNGALGSHRLQGNVRRDRNSQFGGKTTGSAGYGYQFNDQWRLRSSVSTAFKAPTFNDLYFPADPFSAGNPNLKPEKAKSAEVGINRDTATGSLALTAYKTRVTDLIEWQFTTIFSPVNVGTAELRGLSLSGRQRYGDTTVRASADLQDHKNADTDKQLTLRARRHGSLGIDHQFGGSTVGADLIAVGPRYNNEANTVELAGYALLNLRADYRLGERWTVFGRVDNALDRDHEVRWGYATAGRTLFAGIRYDKL
jgi:vitamin B12 transporter